MTVHTITLEQQGVPADIADHRRSIHSSEKCAGTVVLDRRSKRTGHWDSKLVPCPATAVSLVDGRSLCFLHRSIYQLVGGLKVA